MENIRISRTVFPNGDITKYSNGMENKKLLPSNHPDVLELQIKYSRLISEENGKNNKTKKT